MPLNRTQSVRVGCALSLLLGLVVGLLVFRGYQDMTSCHTDRPPLVSMKMTIDPSQGQQFVEQSRQFAFKHNFRFDKDFDEQGGDFHIRMIRKDVEIIARSPFDPGDYEVGFYNYDCVHPIVAADIADLVNDFKSLMGEIPNVAITEEQ